MSRSTLSAAAHIAAMLTLGTSEPPRLTKRKPRYKPPKPQIKVGRGSKSYLIKGVRP